MLFVRVLSVFLGTVIGAGMFGLPFVAFKAGFFVVIVYFLLMALVVAAVNLLYGEVILSTKGVHRLPGYAGRYLNENWKKASFIVMAVGLTGALLAYLIIGGEFLSFLLMPYWGGSAFLYTLLFFVLGSYLIFRGIKSISQIELFLFVVLLVILAVFFIKAFPLVDAAHLKTINLKFLFFPYGVILFSLWGLAVVPEIKEMLLRNLSDKNRARSVFRKIIILGVVFAVLIYLSFIFVILAVSGYNTSKDAISGLKSALGENIIKYGFVFGVITCFTSFLTLGLTLKKILWYDFGFSKNISWLITVITPLALFFLGLRQFIDIIGFTGAVALGLEGIIVIFLYRAFLRKKFSKKMNLVFYFLPVIFMLGIVFEAIYFFFR